MARRGGAPDREGSIAILEEGHRRLKRLIQGLDEPQMIRRRTIGGGDWSVKDLLAHITTWEEAALEALAAWRDGSREPLRAALRADGLDAFNAEGVARKSRMSLDRVLSEFDSVHRRLLREIRTMPGWDDVPPGRRTSTCGFVIGSITGGPGGGFKHAWAHLADLLTYVGSLR